MNPKCPCQGSGILPSGVLGESWVFCGCVPDGTQVRGNYVGPTEIDIEAIPGAVTLDLWPNTAATMLPIVARRLAAELVACADQIEGRSN